MSKLYIADIGGLGDPIEEKGLLALLPAERREKALSYKIPQSRKQSLGAGLLLRHVLRLHGRNVEDVKVNELGKPVIEGPCFNLSHSGDLVICAISEQEIGCDVEKLREMKEPVARRFFTEGEKHYLRNFPSEFCKVWTMKESYLKMTGEGIRVPMDSFEVNPETGQVVRDGKLQACTICTYEAEGYVMSVCTEDKADDRPTWVVI